MNNFRSYQEDIRNLQRFSSNVRYPSNERDQSPAVAAPQRDQNSDIKLPDLGRRCQAQEQENLKESEEYEDDFEDITEEWKDLNTSQRGKGSSQEENTSSSNLDKNQQTAGSQSDEKGNDQKDQNFENSPGKTSLFERQNEPSPQRDNIILPPLKNCSPLWIPQKTRLIQTADGYRSLNFTFQSASEDGQMKEFSDIHQMALTTISKPEFKIRTRHQVII